MMSVSSREEKYGDWQGRRNLVDDIKVARTMEDFGVSPSYGVQKLFWALALHVDENPVVCLPMGSTSTVGLSVYTYMCHYVFCLGG
jgi:hypothetical protein